MNLSLQKIGKEQEIDQDNKLFAVIDKDVFKQANDFAKILQYVR